MSVYVGPVPPGPVITFVPVCFSGMDAIVFRGVIASLEVFGSAAFGAVLGLIGSFVFGPEVLPQLMGLVLGAIAGAITGGALTLWILLSGGCTCPPGSNGFCVSFVFMVVPGTGTLIPTWPFALPEPAACTTLMPPGCP